MPEGDTIHWHANRIRPVLEGQVPDEILTPHPRFARDRWPERLAGQAVRRVDAHGKHLFLRFDGGLTIAGVLPELAEDAAAWPDLQGAIEEAVLDLIAKDTDSDAVERTDELIADLEAVAV